MPKNNKLKGYALISTIFICSICLLILLFSYNIALMERKKSESLKKYIVNSAAADSVKEYLLTDINDYIISSVHSIDTGTVHNFLNNHEGSIKLFYNASFIKYYKEKDCFIIYSYFNENSHREDYYNYYVSDNRIIYKFFNGFLIEGRVDTCS